VAIILHRPSIVLAKVVRRATKVVFGRKWPQYPPCRNSSVTWDIRVHFLSERVCLVRTYCQSGKHGFQSVPFLSCLAVVPRILAIYTAVIVGMDVTLVIGNYHFKRCNRRGRRWLARRPFWVVSYLRSPGVRGVLGAAGHGVTVNGALWQRPHVPEKIVYQKLGGADGTADNKV